MLTTFHQSKYNDCISTNLYQISPHQNDKIDDYNKFKKFCNSTFSIGAPKVFLYSSNHMDMTLL